MRARQMFALAAALVLTAGMVACEDDDDDGTGLDEDLAFSAAMNGANEKPNRRSPRTARAPRPSR